MRALRRRSAAAACPRRTSRCRCSARPSTATRPRTSSARSSTATTRRRSSCRCSTTTTAALALDAILLDEETHQHPLLALARVLPRRHGRAVGLRRSSCRRSCRRSRARSSTRRSGSPARGRRSSSATCGTTCTTRATSSSRRRARAGMVMHVFNLPSYPVRVQGDPGRLRPGQEHRPRDGDVEVPARARGRPRRADGAHVEFTNLALPLDALRAGAARAARRAGAVGDRDRRRQPDRQALLRRAPPDAAQPLPRDGDARAARARRARVRRRDPRARDRERLPRRPASGATSG